MCSPRPGASYAMQYDMVRSIRDLDPWSRSRIDISRSNHISFDSSRRGEHDGAIISVLTLNTTELLAKQNIGKFRHFWPLGGGGQNFDLRKKSS